ncbi:hypothetical protein Syun_006081 [Stephania yunnanensis]|uniref:CCHC-type domain-containing protein n=1 Tax=Stephania yunnanensis TaxID=152371 RepID=A0AAP0KWZ7_9MAGN
MEIDIDDGNGDSAHAMRKPEAPPIPEDEERSTKKVKNKRTVEEVNKTSFNISNLTSFRDIIAQHRNALQEQQEGEDPPLSPDDFVRNKTSRPVKLNFSERVQTKMNEAMKKCVMIRVLGKGISYMTLSNRIKLLWNLKGSLRLTDIDNGYYMAKFSLNEDYMHVLLDGPWTIMGHYLTVQPWTPHFATDRQNLSAVATWIRLLWLPFVYYRKNILREIAETIGDFIKIDYNTVSGERGKFARMAVILDLRDPLVPEMEIDGRLQRIEYESLPYICYKCAMYGHTVDSCPDVIRAKPNGHDGTEAPTTMERIVLAKVLLLPSSTVAQLSENSPDAAGPWIHAPRRGRRPNPRVSETAGKSGHNLTIKETSQSRFEILANMPTDAEEDPQSHNQREMTKDTREWRSSATEW